MHKLILFFLVLLITSVGYCQINKEGDVMLSNIDTDDGFNVRVDNNLYCPVSVKLTLNLENLKADKSSRYFLVPPRASGHELLKLKVKQPDSSSSYISKVNWSKGNMFLKEYDTLYPYSLPYKSKKSYSLTQGYNGKLTHQKSFALDFAMREGSMVTAARDGIVVVVVDNNNIHCTGKNCAKFNNFVMVYHSDNTFALYAHIQYKGALVKNGDKIKHDQPIALSGNVGNSTGPHLHFQVHQEHFCKKHNCVSNHSVATLFRTGKGGKKLRNLKPGRAYTKGY
jgi:murein DD-endopeptidase MepM/ murein hydrolase activator NlpD